MEWHAALVTGKIWTRASPDFVPVFAHEMAVDFLVFKLGAPGVDWMCGLLDLLNCNNECL